MPFQCSLVISLDTWCRFSSLSMFSCHLTGHLVSVLLTFNVLLSSYWTLGVGSPHFQCSLVILLDTWCRFSSLSMFPCHLTGHLVSVLLTFNVPLSSYWTLGVGSPHFQCSLVILLDTWCRFSSLSMFSCHLTGHLVSVLLTFNVLLSSYWTLGVGSPHFQCSLVILLDTWCRFSSLSMFPCHLTGHLVSVLLTFNVPLSSYWTLGVGSPHFQCSLVILLDTWCRFSSLSMFSCHLTGHLVSVLLTFNVPLSSYWTLGVGSPHFQCSLVILLDTWCRFSSLSMFPCHLTGHLVSVLLTFNVPLSSYWTLGVGSPHFQCSLVILLDTWCRFSSLSMFPCHLTGHLVSVLLTFNVLLSSYWTPGVGSPHFQCSLVISLDTWCRFSSLSKQPTRHVTLQTDRHIVSYADKAYGKVVVSMCHNSAEYIYSNDCNY